MPATMEQLQGEHAKGVADNNALGVIEYESPNQPQSDAVYEVVEGYKTLSDGQRLGPGQRFHPTEKQVADGSLKNKARELSATEYRGIHRHERRPQSTGADIGIRALPMAETTLDIALRNDLTVEDFEGIEPRYEGRYTRSQVTEIIEAKSASEDGGES